MKHTHLPSLEAVRNRLTKLATQHLRSADKHKFPLGRSVAEAKAEAVLRCLRELEYVTTIESKVKKKVPA